MSKRSWTLAKAATAITTGVAAASLMPLDAITAGAAMAQLEQSKPSPTFQRLQQLQKVERNKQSTEDAKWRSFPGHASTATGSKPRPMDVAASYFLNQMQGAQTPKTKCEFYWSGWKLNSSGARVTRVRGCRDSHVAVDCKSLKVSWESPLRFLGSPPGWSTWQLPSSADFETTQMVAALCDNIALPTSK